MPRAFEWSLVGADSAAAIAELHAADDTRAWMVLHVFVAEEPIETGDHEVGFEEPVAGSGSFELVVRRWVPIE